MNTSRPPKTEPPPPSSAQVVGETHAFVRAADGTRLFARSVPGPEGVPHALFCDGILCDGFIWKYLWPALAGEIPLTHWHYRGHGRSAPPSDPDRIGIRAHADDLRAVRAHLGDPPCVLVGHSMGCQVALEAYHATPKNVAGLVLLCGSFGRVTSTFRGVPILELVLPKLLDAVEKAPDLARAIWSRIPAETAVKLAMSVRDIDPARVNVADMVPYVQHMTHVDFPMFLRMLRAAGEHSASEYLSDIQVPTLIVAGERDTFTPAFLAERMAEAIPGAELMIVKEGTHVAPLEAPDAVNGRIREFFRDRVTGQTR